MIKTYTINWAWAGAYIILIAILGLNIYSVYNKGEDRSMTVEGTTTIKAVPDNFVFYPQFEIAETDKSKVKEALAAKSTDVINRLKELGLKDKDIQLNASQYDDYTMKGSPDGATSDIMPQQTTASMTITVNDKALAQKVQDYLGTTDATGQLTPQATFSQEKQRQLTSEAEAKAITDAKEKADTLAKNLDSRRGKVITINPVDDGPIAYPMMEANDSSARSSLPIQPGTNEFTYRISVKFELK